MKVIPFVLAFVISAVITMPGVSMGMRMIHPARCVGGGSGSQAIIGQGGLTNSAINKPVYCPLVNDVDEAGDFDIYVSVCDRTTTATVSAQICSIPLDGAVIACGGIENSGLPVSHKGPETVLLFTENHPLNVGPEYLVVQVPSLQITLTGICVAVVPDECTASFFGTGTPSCPN